MKMQGVRIGSVSTSRKSDDPGYKIRRRLFWHCLRIHDISHGDQDKSRPTHSYAVLCRHSAAVVRECFQRSTLTNSQPTQRSLGPFLEFILTITLVFITLSFFTVLCAIFSQENSPHHFHQIHLCLHTMKSTTVALLALSAGSASAQFFVLYGRDTVTSRIDPIVSPGGIGMHAHEFMGAGNIDQNSNYDSLQQSSCSSVGRANGNPIIEDKSAYWHPTLYVKANNGTYLRVPVSSLYLRMTIT
jgi:hypothetical protein